MTIYPARLSDSTPENPSQRRAGNVTEHGAAQPRLLRPQPAHSRVQPAVRAHRHIPPQDRRATARNIWYVMFKQWTKSLTFNFFYFMFDRWRCF